jgi:hypothetical protein
MEETPEYRIYSSVWILMTCIEGNTRCRAYFVSVPPKERISEVIRETTNILPGLEIGEVKGLGGERYTFEVTGNGLTEQCMAWFEKVPYKGD